MLTFLFKEDREMFSKLDLTENADKFKLDCMQYKQNAAVSCGVLCWVGHFLAAVGVVTGKFLAEAHAEKGAVDEFVVIFRLLP